MAFKLTKAEDTRKFEIESNLGSAYNEFEQARDELQGKIEDLIREFNDGPLTKFNEAVAEARGFVEDIKNERQGEFDDKSERWQDGERGQAAQEWLQQWESGESSLEELSEIEVPDLQIELSDPEMVLCELPTEMEA